MNRWRISVQSSGGLARVSVHDNERVVGVISMPVKAYHEASKALIILVTSIAQSSISETLSKRIWADAQMMTAGLDGDAAVDKMEAFGWTKEKIDAYAVELALTLSQRLVERLP